MSKGSNRRPAAVPRATVDANYERTFRVKPTEPSTIREISAMLQRHPLRLTDAEFDAILTPSGRADAAS